MPISQSQRGRERMNRENIHSASQYPETQQQQQPPSIPPKHKRRDSSGSQHNFNFSAEAHSRRGDSAEQQQQAIPRSPPPNYSNGPASPPPRPPKEPTNSTSTSGSYAVKVRGSQSSGLSSTAASRGSQGTFGTRNSQSSSVNRNTDGMMAELPGDLVGLGLTMQSPETNREGTRSKSKQRASGSSGPSSRRKSLTDSGMPRRPVKRKLRVLSLDGGGIRGYSTLVILSDLMHRVHVLINKSPPPSPYQLPRPCEFFDVIGGNGTGGLIGLMLGRMRMDVETCKEYYEALTRYVFFTDKTILGLPYGKTLFKAARLEEAIKTCVRESTIYDHLPILPYDPTSPRNEVFRSDTPPVASTISGPKMSRKSSWGSSRGSSLAGNRNSNNQPETISVWSSSNGSTTTVNTTNTGESPKFKGKLSNNGPLGNPNALLLDPRPGACRMFLTTQYAGSNRSHPPVLLRSYPSARDPNQSSFYNCTIWEAGRATCATRTAFKPITIGTTTFLDEGYGKYNPAVTVLEEATSQEEFPNSEITCFVSIGTGKREANVAGGGGLRQDKQLWWENMGMLEQYAEAKKRLIAKLEDCENVHLEIKGQKGKPGLFETKGLRGEDYYRFNVEVGVGEFGMNEWNRLAEVSTGTRRYLASTAVAEEMKACAEKLVVVWRENLEREHMERGIPESVFEEDEEEDYVDSDEVTATKKRVERVKKGRRNSGGYATASPVAQGRERRSNKFSSTSPPLSPAIAELEADLDNARAEWSSSNSAATNYTTSSSETEAHQQQYYTPRTTQTSKFTPSYASPPHAQSEWRPPKHNPSPNPPPTGPPPQSSTSVSYFSPKRPARDVDPRNPTNDPQLQAWILAQQAHNQDGGGPIPIPSPGDFLPQAPLTSTAPHLGESDDEFDNGDYNNQGRYIPRIDRFSIPMNPEIRVTSPTTVAGDSPRGSPALEQMVKKRSIEGDRRERRERREKKERERRERMAREEGGRI